MSGNDQYNLKLWQLVLIVVIQLVTALGSYFTLKADLYNHIDNTDVHMTYEAKIQHFVPRGEFGDMKDSIKEIKDRQKRIEEKLDRLLDK